MSTLEPIHSRQYKEKKIEIKKIDFEALKYANADTVIGEEIENDTAENNLEN